MLSAAPNGFASAGPGLRCAAHTTVVSRCTTWATAFSDRAREGTFPLDRLGIPLKMGHPLAARRRAAHATYIALQPVSTLPPYGRGGWARAGRVAVTVSGSAFDWPPDGARSPP